jgi:putative hemolysin
VAGLYTRTLFHYDERLVDRLSPALELGRSFVRPEYQRNYGALLSLWKGIGRLVVVNPRYRTLFGTVSISTRYTDTTRQLLMHFLSQNHRDDQLAELAVALNPPTRTKSPTPLGLAPRSIDEVNRLVSASEPDGKGIPVLLRQYLKLDAQLIGFNVDPQFGDALDALMMVDLTRVDRAILNRYLGREGAASFLAAHQRPMVTVAA